LVLGEGLPALVPLALPSALVFAPVIFFAIIVNLTWFAKSVNSCIISICMIQYKLRCENDHRFDGWFPNIDEFRRQQKKDLLICPFCDTKKVDRSIISPNVGKTKSKIIKTKSQKEKQDHYREQVTDNTMMLASRAKDVLKEIKKYVVVEFENVGDRFLKEYRKHEKGERDDKFYGTPTQEEVNELLEEGIDLFHVPTVKEDA